MEESVELGEGLAALGPQGVRRIQNPRNPLLLVEGREGNRQVGDGLPGYAFDCRTARQTLKVRYAFFLSHQKRKSGRKIKSNAGISSL